MTGEFCEHGKIWTICNVCGKDIIKRAKQERKIPSEPEETPKKVQREVKAPPREPEPTEYESGEF